MPACCSLASSSPPSCSISGYLKAVVLASIAQEVCDLSRMRYGSMQVSG